MQEMLLAVLTPAAVLALVMGTLLAGIFHLLAATKGSRLLVSWTVGVTTFCVGAVLSDFFHLSILSLGPIDLVLPSVLSIAAMNVARLAKL
ncbi:MAG: hypothetical protein ACP5G7_00800 [Anaerolineae bacterium]